MSADRSIPNISPAAETATPSFEKGRRPMTTSERRSAFLSNPRVRSGVFAGAVATIGALLLPLALASGAQAAPVPASAPAAVAPASAPAAVVTPTTRSRQRATVAPSNRSRGAPTPR
jgi:hypothetical protein